MVQSTVYDELRKDLNDLPWVIREFLVGNVVVGNYTQHGASTIGSILRQRMVKDQMNVNGDGI